MPSSKLQLFFFTTLDPIEFLLRSLDLLVHFITPDLEP